MRGRLRRDARARRRRRQRSAPWRILGISLTYFVALLLFAAMVAIGVASMIDLQQPVHWGTFTESRCEPVKYGCRSIGTWVSDDRSIVKEGISLDGAVDSDGTARAAFRPDGIISDESNNVVHTSLWIGAGPWVCAAGALVFAVRVLAHASDRGHLKSARLAYRRLALRRAVPN